MKKIILSLIALSAIAVSSCQPTTAKAEAEKQDVYRISATISNQNITDFQEDAQGYIWIGNHTRTEQIQRTRIPAILQFQRLTATARR